MDRGRHVTRPDFFAYVVLEGQSELSPVAARPDDETVGELVAYYRALSGEHHDWDGFGPRWLPRGGWSSASRRSAPHGMLRLTQ